MTTAEEFPTVEEVGAVAIHMFNQDPAWWRTHYPQALAVIVERWLYCHPADEVTP